MIFQNPSAWYALPLLLIPILLNFYLIKPKSLTVLPSLFFFNQLIKKKRLILRKQPWLIVVLEVLFLFLVIFLLSRPIIPTVSNQKNQLMILIDDSPSMQYYFTENNLENQALYGWVQKTIEQEIYRSIEVKKMSELNNLNTIKLNSQEKLSQYLQEFQTSPKVWLVSELEFFFKQLLDNLQLDNYDFVLYSDLRKNHFNSITDKAYFPAVINLFSLPPSPTIKSIDNQRNNFFDRESLNTTVEIDNQSQTQSDDVFLEAQLNQKLIYFKKITNQLSTENDSKQNPSTFFKISIPLLANLENSDNKKQSKGNSHVKKENNASHSTLQNLDFFLKRDNQIFQHLEKQIHVFDKKIIGVVGNDLSFQFARSLMAYDLIKNHLSIQKVDKPNKLVIFDTIFLFYPFQVYSTVPSASHSASTFSTTSTASITTIHPNKKYLVWLSPESSVRNINQWLRNIGLQEVTFQERKMIKLRDRLSFRRKNGRTTHQLLDEQEEQLSIQSYLTVYQETREAPTTILSINNIPIIFKIRNLVFITMLRPFDLFEALSSNYLTWVYEAAFQLWQEDIKKQPNTTVFIKDEKASNTKAGNRVISQGDLTELGSEKLENLKPYIHSYQYVANSTYSEQEKLKFDLIKFIIILQLIIFSLIVMIIYQRIDNKNSK